LVSYYLDDIPCKTYNYIFVFVKVTPETLTGSIFPDTGIVETTGRLIRFKNSFEANAFIAYLYNFHVLIDSGILTEE